MFVLTTCDVCAVKYLEVVVVVHDHVAVVAHAAAAVNGVALPCPANVRADHLVFVAVVPVGYVNVAVLVNSNGRIASNIGGRCVNRLRDPGCSIMVLEHGTVANVAGVRVRDMRPFMSVQHDTYLIVVHIALQGLGGPR